MAAYLPPGVMQLNGSSGPAPRQPINIPVPPPHPNPPPPPPTPPTHPTPTPPTPPAHRAHQPGARQVGAMPPNAMPPNAMPFSAMPSHAMPSHANWPPPVTHALPPRMTTPPLARVQLPPQRRSRHMAEISDIRNENRSEADARQLLSTFVIIRMEKWPNPNEVDDEGRPVRPTWQRVSFIQETDISQQEATRKVRELIRETPPVRDKKSELGPAVQRQVEKAQTMLEDREPDPRYHYVLAQLESKTKRVRDESPLLCIKSHRKGKKSDEYKVLRAKSKRAHKLERVSVTAYFKRAPRPNENALRMLEESERSREQRPSIQAAPMAPPPLCMQSSHAVHHRPGPPLPSLPPPQPPPPPPPPPPPGWPMAGQPMEPGGPRDQAGQSRPDVEAIRSGGHGARVYHGSPRDSRSSVTSDEAWDSDGSGYMTPESSIESSSRRSHHKRYRNRSHHRHRDRAEFFGLEVPHHHSKRDKGYISAALSPRPFSPGPQALAPAVNIDRVREQAYLRGRDDEARIGAFRPKVIQDAPSFRRLPEHEARREIMADALNMVQSRLQRTHLEDETRRERDLKREQDARFNRSRDDLDSGQRPHDRLRHDSADGVPRTMHEAREYIRHREWSREMEHNSPFVLAGRQGSYYVSRYPPSEGTK